MKVKDIADALTARLLGDGGLVVDRIVHPADARGPADLAVAVAEEALPGLSNCSAAAVVVASAGAQAAERFKAAIVVEAARPALALLTKLFDPGPQCAAGIHVTAVIARDAAIGEGASIGPYAVVGPRSRIGARAAVMSHVCIGADVSIGADARLFPGVRIGDRIVVGDRVVLHHNASLGADGFGFLPDGRRIHSLGTVEIGDDVEIGAGSTIDRATLRTTRIGARTKIDNLVHIAHNVEIGEDCRICGMVGIAGSVRIGDRAVLGGGVGIADHVTIGPDARVAARSGVGTNVPAGVTVSGYPAMRHDRTLEHLVYLGRQKALHRRVEALEARLATRGDASKKPENKE